MPRETLERGAHERSAPDRQRRVGPVLAGQPLVLSSYQAHPFTGRAAYRVTGNAGDAEDVLQTVFLRLLKRDPGAEPVGNMASFLHRAAVNAALDLVRSRQNIRHVPLDEMEPVLAEPVHRNPDRLHHAGEIREWLRGALARLNPRIPGKFMLRFFDGKDNPEIARL